MRAKPTGPRALPHMRSYPRRIRALARPRSERAGLGWPREGVWNSWERSEPPTYTQSLMQGRAMNQSPRTALPMLSRQRAEVVQSVSMATYKHPPG